jgi:hypothetical protein
MRTSDKILRQVRRALLCAFLLAGVVSLLLAALALHAIPLLAADGPLTGAEELWLLFASAGLLCAVLLCVEAARERIVQRAGLWLDHTLAQRILRNGSRRATPADALRSDAAAIARLRDALLERRIAPLLSLPWACFPLALLALLQPVLAAICAVSALALLLIAMAQGPVLARLEQQRLRAQERVATWWRGLSPAPLTVDAARDWERLNSAHIAAAYALDRRVLRLCDIARAVAVVSLLSAAALCAWLSLRNALTPGLLAACLLLHAQALAPCTRLLAGLKSVRRAVRDYRRLAAPAAERRPAHAAYPALEAQHVPLPTFTTPVPRLHIGGPLGLGFGAAALLLAALAGAATLLSPDQIALLAGDARLAAHTVPVRHAKGGVAARVHVIRGLDVKAGDVLVSLDTTVLDRQIASLRNDADAARRHLDRVSYEAAALASASPASATDRTRLHALEEQMAELQQRADALPTRITLAELELARSVIRAPVSGRVVTLAVRAPNDTIAPGAIVAEIVPAQSNPQSTIYDRLAEPLLRTMHRVLRSLYQENAA